MLDNIQRRIARKMSIPKHNIPQLFEPVQVLRYDEGMYYRLLVDNAYDPKPRYITFQIYLTDVEKGGRDRVPSTRVIVQGCGWKSDSMVELEEEEEEYR